MTGLEWVTALARIGGLGAGSAGDAATRVLEAVSLADAAHTKIGAYSRGMRQRVKLAQALVHSPSLLVLDEPLAGMDPLGRRRTMRLLRDWARAGTTVVISSHVLHEIEQLTSNVLLMNNGRLLAEGDVHQIRALIDDHPHTVMIRSADPRAVAGQLVGCLYVKSLRFEADAIVVQTDRPDEFYTHLTAVAASGVAGVIDEVSSPDAPWFPI